MSGAQIKAIEFVLPNFKQNTKEFSRFNPDWNIEKIIDTTGIKNIFISNNKEDIISLSLKSASKVLKKFPKKKIDFLIFVTQTSNLKFPSASCVMQNLLKLRNDILAFDVNMGCSGYIYALNLAKNIILGEKCKNGLIICSDVYTKFIGKNNRSCRPIFSDASSATIVSKSKKGSIKDFVFGTDGSGAKDLVLYENSKEMFMNGSRVALFTFKRIPNSIHKLLKKGNKKLHQIDKFIFHQASKYVLNNLYRVLKIEKDKKFDNYSRIGNTVSSSIPIALKIASKQKKIKHNDHIVLSGFGVGLSWGAVIVKWKKIK